MPRHVDHGARRDLVAPTAADLVAAEGLEALTVRRVAEAAATAPPWSATTSPTAVTWS